MWRVLFGSIIPASLLGAWEWASRSGTLTLESLSRPSDILLAGYFGIRDGSILLATAQTFETAMLGLALAAVAGILCGAVLGLSPILDRVTSPTVEALRAIPAVAFMPLA
jgi:ABC-type nitrate/sulfonate/bicarbonate transport system permease component